ncbi:MAG: hypothetical protein NTZ33_14670 [Bacteroidetes bacterium]|nr:hypothetical protein [Bacteroidota bacterium]
MFNKNLIMLNWTNIINQVSKIQIKSITDQLFKYALLFSVFAVITSIFKSPNWVIIILFSVTGLLILTGIIFYIYFAINNPDYLRSESFQIKKQSIEMLGDKDNQLNSNAENITLIASPFSLIDSDNNKDIGE